MGVKCDYVSIISVLRFKINIFCKSTQRYTLFRPGKSRLTGFNGSMPNGFCGPKTVKDGVNRKSIS